MRIFSVRAMLASICIAALLVFACQRENISVSKSAKVENSTVVDPCTTCDYQDLHKTVGQKEVVGSVAVCQTATALTITFTVSGEREEAWFNQTGIRIDPYGSGFTSLNPGLIDRTQNHGTKIRSFTYTVLLSDIQRKVGDVWTPVVAGDVICIAAYAVVPGPDGAGGMVWAGNQVPPEGNPNANYFCYTIKPCSTPPPPNDNCTFTQGYWFAKPNGSQWPGTLETTGQSFGGWSYTYAEARAIFFGSNAKSGKTDAKQAFLQGLALKLSIAGGATPCADAATALNTIEAYFTGKAKVTPTNINTNTYPSNTAIRTAAGIISACLNANHCDNTPSN